jgi:uncharacterized protein (DUF2147 family)
MPASQPARCALQALGALMAACFNQPAAAQSSSDIAGFWRTPSGDAIAHVTPCGQTLCATLVWLAGDSHVRDARNPIPARRGQRVCGLTIFSRFVAAPGGAWTGGAIYDPETGVTITDVNASFNRNQMTLLVGRGMFAGRETWQRVAPPLQPCARALNSGGPR